MRALSQYALTQEILRTDVSGMPLEWIDYRDAVRLYHTSRLPTLSANPVFALRRNQRPHGPADDRPVNSIVATTGHSHNPGGLHGLPPPLNNQTLFNRDAYLCLYCALRFPTTLLSRDHVTPLRAAAAIPGTMSPPLAAAATTSRPRARPSRPAATDRRAVHAHLRRVHLPQGAACAGGPDGVPDRPLPADQPASRAPAHRAAAGTP